MIKEYGSTADNISAYIGPHNMGILCYEVGYDVACLFTQDEMYSGIEIFKDGKLNLQKCILKQLELSGIHHANIFCADLCTFCNDTYKFHSFRKQQENFGRLFSFVILK